MSGRLVDSTGVELSKEEMKYRHRSLSKKSKDNARLLSAGKYDNEIMV